MFYYILLASMLFVVVQAVFAYKIGYFTQRQLHRRGINGFSFLDHGGMWVDFFVLPVTIAHLVTSYRLPYISWASGTCLAVTLLIAFSEVHDYNKASLVYPNMHHIKGKTTFAGWIHIIYGTIMLWLLLLVYAVEIWPRKMSHSDLLWTSIAVSLVLIIGEPQLSQKWFRQNRSVLMKSIVRVTALLLLVWAIAWSRFH